MCGRKTCGKKERGDNRLPFFYSKDSLITGTIFNMAICSICEGDMETGRRLIEQIKTEWPDSDIASRDFSFLEPVSYE